jgi:cysteine desulfurase/selenocysteine lyase
MSSHEGSWDDFRHEMPVTNRWAYFDHSAVSPLPQRSAAALASWSDQIMREGDTVWPDWHRRLEEVRGLFAQLLGASAAEIALVHSTTEGINFVAEGFPWQPGDNVVTLDNEFPSNQYPWLHQASRGVETRRVATDGGRVNLARLDDACDARTRIVAISWVGYLSGWRIDLDEVAEFVHRRGALLFVDAIQGLGGYPIDVGKTSIDFLAADGHKWLLGPEGAGVFYVRAKHLELLRPVGVGWNSVLHASDYSRIELTFKSTAGRFEGGSPNMPGIMALGPSLELLMSYGAERIGKRIVELADTASDQLQSIGAEIISPREGKHRSAIVTFVVPGRDSLALRKHCLNAGVALAHRGGKLRISPHAYQNEDDINRLIEALRNG